MGIDNVEKYSKYKPKKFLGQNFLVDDNIARKIVNSLNITPDDFVIEIGPGYGSLTKHFLESATNYLAVEIDKSISGKLKEELFSREKGKNVNILNGDFLKLNLANILEQYIPSGKKLNVKVAGNLPYNITTEVLFKLFENRDLVTSATLMVQKEVAQRINSKPNTKEYGILGIFTQYNADVKILFNVPPTAFFPKPKIQSSVIELQFGNVKHKTKDYKLFRELVRESFGKRRKTMRNSLKDFFERKKIDGSKIKFDFSRRPENLTIEEFINLANEIYILSNSDEQAGRSSRVPGTV